MTIIETPPKSAIKLFFASMQFWLCNIIGWLVFDIAQSVRDSFDGSPLITNLIENTPTAILGMFASLCVNFFYKKLQWHKQHPIHLIPIAGLISITFSCINISINFFDLVISIPQICSRQYPRPPYSCGIISNLFLQSLGAMLVWCLFYFLIQAERKSHQEVRFSAWDTSKALFTLLALIHLGKILSVIAYVDWGNTYYLFSKTYNIETICGLICTVFFATYVIFIKPGGAIFDSRILPLISTLCVMSFCCTLLNIGTQGAFSRLYYLQASDKLPLSNYIYYVFFGSTYGNFPTKEMLAGILQGGFTDILLISLFFLSYRYSGHWQKKPSLGPTVINTKKVCIFWCFNFLFWLVFALLIYSTDLMDLTSYGKSVPLISTISFVGIGIFTGAVLGSQIKEFAAKKTAPIALGLKIFIASLSMGISLTSSLWFINYAYIFVILDGYGIQNYSSFVTSANYLLASILVSFLLCGLWSFICYMIESQYIQRDSTIKRLQIEMNMKEVQLNALAGKVDPHFVFNALNNIRALVDEDSEKARAAIVVLSDILRSPITNNSQDKILVAKEMLLVRNYIALSKIQFEDRLDYKEDVSDDANIALIPSMMLQILVENAIKHGISQLPDGGALLLQIRKREQQLVCTIINNGKLVLNSSTSGFGVGIKAIHERLVLLYNNTASFSLKEENNTVIAELILPFESSV